LKLRIVDTAIIVTATAFLTIGCSSSDKSEEKAPPPKKMMDKSSDVTVKVVKKTHDTPHWGYDGLFGPALWGNLDPSFSTCKDGKSQSPIDLVYKKPTSTQKIEFLYEEGPLAIADTGHNLLATGTKGSLVSVAGDTYNLVQLHIHSPAEHTLSGKSFDAAIHFLHKNSAGQILMSSVLINEGTANPVFDQIIKNVPTTKKKVEKSGVNFNPKNLLPAIHTHYDYVGSLSHPPCTEGVRWIVLNTPITVSKEQLAKLKGYYQNNSRPIQPLNGRTVTNY